jgi:hypothetical protein
MHDSGKPDHFAKGIVCGKRKASCALMPVIVMRKREKIPLAFLADQIGVAPEGTSKSAVLFRPCAAQGCRQNLGERHSNSAGSTIVTRRPLSESRESETMPAQSSTNSSIIGSPKPYPGPSRPVAAPGEPPPLTMWPPDRYHRRQE